ncbi:MAG: GxxExxY protein [Bacteroidales bacterium]
MSKLLYQELTEKIINSFFTVYKNLGFGFLEKVYENALTHELQVQKLYADKQRSIRVYYNDNIVGDYYADIIVNDLIIIEIKAAAFLVEEHELQLINYLKATDKEVGLLLNFGKKPEFKRKIFTNERKTRI